jgi:flagellar hook-basal body complex protein FliE
MPDPVSSNPLRPLGPVAPGQSVRPPAPAGGDDFAAALRRQLEQVSRMQTEADQGVQSLLTGESQNVTEVFAAARKAQVAFSLLMEIRNKLVDAYTEIRQLRV